MDKKYIGSVFLYLGIGVTAVFLIVFVLYHLLGWGNVSYSTRPAARITAEDAIETQAYLFKSETVIYCPEGKKLYSDLPAGETVRANDRVAGLYDCTDDRIGLLAEYDAALALLRSANQREELQIIDGKLKTLTASLRARSDTGGTAALEKEIKELQTELDRRKKVLGTVSDYNNEIARYSTLRANLLAEIGKADEVIAPVAGSYYPVCDGYEALFSADKLRTITPQDFEALTAKEPERPPEGMQTGGKIVTDPRWNVAVTVTGERTVDFTLGRTYTLEKLTSGERVSAKLERIAADAASGKTLLVFSLASLPTEAPARCETVRLIISSSTGLMVPSAALRSVKGKDGEPVTGVYVKEGNRFRFRKVEILSKHDGYFLAKEMTPDLEGYKEYLALNDIMVTAGKNLREGYHE